MLWLLLGSWGCRFVEIEVIGNVNVDFDRLC